MSWLARLWRNHRAAVLAVCTVAAVALVVAVIWPITDLIARLDVGAISGPQRAFHLQTARESVRTQLLTLGAGIFAAGALIYTARNFTLAGHQLDLSRQAMELTEQGQRRTLELTEQGQVTDRYTKAIDQLGSDKLDVRIGGIYALERIARDSAKDRPAVIDVLAAFVREHSREPWPPLPADDQSGAGSPERATRPDVQAAVTVIGRRNIQLDDQRVNLTDANLSGADLTGANLTEAGFANAKLPGAILVGANFTGANLSNADFSGANLYNAILTGSYPTGANFTDALLGGANLGGALLLGADLTCANLTGANLHGALLRGARWPSDVEVPAGWQLDTASGFWSEPMSIPAMRQ
jgi:Pentapeptide repeats (8 copies)